MELTRLKRELRKGGSPIFEEALALFDAIDQVRENAESQEEWLRQGEYPNEGDIAQFVRESTDLLISTLLILPSVDLQGLLSVILERQNYEEVLKSLETWKRRSDEAAAKRNEELGDLDDHPF
jgi:hypothetical protein